MSINFQLYSNTSLTTPVSGPVVFTVAEDGSSGWQVQQFWFGSTIADRRVQRVSDPGVDNIIFKFSDTNIGVEPEVDNLQFSSDGLVWGADGADLDTGLVQIDSGVANAYTFYVRAQVWSGATVNYYSHIRLITDSLREIAIP